MGEASDLGEAEISFVLAGTGWSWPDGVACWYPDSGEAAPGGSA